MNSVGNYNSSSYYAMLNSPDSPGSGPVDTNPAFIKLVDAAWFALYEFNQNPTDATTQAMMTAVSNLDAFLKQNPPGPNDPGATAILNDLNNAVFPGGPTIAQICATSPSDPNYAQDVAWFEKNGSTALNSLTNDTHSFGSSYSDQGDQAIQNDMQQLDLDLQIFEELQNSSNPDPNEVYYTMMNIANLINKLNTDLQAAEGGKGVSDGYLSALETFLNTPVTVGGQSLESLATALIAPPGPPSQQAYTSFLTALQTLGEKSGGNDMLRNLLEKVYSEEYN